MYNASLGSLLKEVQKNENVTQDLNLAISDYVVCKDKYQEGIDRYNRALAFTTDVSSMESSDMDTQAMKNYLMLYQRMLGQTVDTDIASLESFKEKVESTWKSFIESLKKLAGAFTKAWSTLKRKLSNFFRSKSKNGDKVDEEKLKNSNSSLTIDFNKMELEFNNKTASLSSINRPFFVGLNGHMDEEKWFVGQVLDNLNNSEPVVTALREVYVRTSELLNDSREIIERSLDDKKTPDDYKKVIGQYKKDTEHFGEKINKIDCGFFPFQMEESGELVKVDVDVVLKDSSISYLAVERVTDLIELSNEITDKNNTFYKTLNDKAFDELDKKYSEWLDYLLKVDGVVPQDMVTFINDRVSTLKDINERIYLMQVQTTLLVEAIRKVVPKITS